MNKRCFLILLLILLMNGCYIQRTIPTIQFQPIEKLQHELNTIIENPEFYNAHLGVAIQSLKTGEFFYLKNEHKNFIPASNMKLFTTAVALLKLTPDFTYCTSVFKNGELREDGVLHGDLIIKGSGDPSITGRFHSGKMTQVLEQWADSLINKGIKAITGNIVGDDNLFDDEILGEGWAWDYQSDWYAAQISALSFNDNCMDILLSPGDSIGAPAKFRLEPKNDFVAITNRVTTVAPELEEDIFINRKRGTNVVEIAGDIAITAKEKRDWFTVENPTLFTVTIFKQILEQKGIIVNGLAKDIDDYPPDDYDSKEVLAKYYSPPLSQIVNTINKESQNLYAELLLRTLGAKFKGHGDARSGIEVIKESLYAMGINSIHLNMVDGSGLSRLNLVTPMQIITLLRYMRTSAVSDYFFNSLSIAGVNGSLKHRLKQTQTNGKVKGKSGYLGSVVALSGYLVTIDREELAFSIMINHYTTPTSMAHKIQDLICERLINFKRD